MSTLVAQVRTLSGATEAEAADARIIEALNASSVRIANQRLTWEKHPDGTDTRVAQLAIAAYLVEATGAAGSVTPVVLHDAAGDAIADLSIAQNGIVTAAGVADLPTTYVSGRLFDIHAAAAEIVGDRIVAIAGDFDFKRGDQSFSRSQALPGLKALKRELTRKRVPRRRGETVMPDQQAAT